MIVQSWLKISPHVAGRAIPVFSNTKYRRKGKEKKLIEKVCFLSASGTSLSSYCYRWHLKQKPRSWRAHPPCHCRGFDHIRVPVLSCSLINFGKTLKLIITFAKPISQSSSLKPLNVTRETYFLNIWTRKQSKRWCLDTVLTFFIIVLKTRGLAVYTAVHWITLRTSHSKDRRLVDDFTLLCHLLLQICSYQLLDQFNRSVYS